MSRYSGSAVFVVLTAVAFAAVFHWLGWCKLIGGIIGWFAASFVAATMHAFEGRS